MDDEFEFRTSKISAKEHQDDRIPSQEPAIVQSAADFPVAKPTIDRETHILLTNLSLLTGLPFFPEAFLGVSVHISFTFSSTILQCRSNAFTRASNLRLLRHEIKTCV